MITHLCCKKYDGQYKYTNVQSFSSICLDDWQFVESESLSHYCEVQNTAEDTE